MGAAIMGASTMAVALVLLAVYTASATPDNGDLHNANALVPESDFVEYDLDTPLGKDADKKQKELVKEANKVMAKKITVPKVFKDQPTRGKKAHKEEGSMAAKAGKKLLKNAHGQTVTAESVRLRKDHEGSLNPTPPWSKPTKAAKDAKNNAIKRLKDHFAAEKKAADSLKWADEVVTARVHKKKKFKAAIARQDAWDRAAKQKEDAARAKIEKAKEDAKYDNIVSKKWIKVLKNSKDPSLKEAGAAAAAALKKANAQKKKKAEQPPIKEHTNKPPLPASSNPTVTPEAHAMAAAQQVMKNGGAPKKK